MKKKVVIMRGIPGSGKTTFVAQNYPKASVFSADHYFETRYHRGGEEVVEYNFNPDRLENAHTACLREFVTVLTNSDIDLLVVDNTNIQIADIAPYAALALAYGHELEIITFIIDVDRAHVRNIHKVPLLTCERMAEQLTKQGRLFPVRWAVRHTIMEIKS